MYKNISVNICKNIYRDMYKNMRLVLTAWESDFGHMSGLVTAQSVHIGKSVVFVNVYV